MSHGGIPDMEPSFWLSESAHSTPKRLKPDVEVGLRKAGQEEKTEEMRVMQFSRPRPESNLVFKECDKI